MYDICVGALEMMFSHKKSLLTIIRSIRSDLPTNFYYTSFILTLASPSEA